VFARVSEKMENTRLTCRKYPLTVILIQIRSLFSQYSLSCVFWSTTYSVNTLSAQLQCVTVPLVFTACEKVQLRLSHGSQEVCCNNIVFKSVPSGSHCLHIDQTTPPETHTHTHTHTHSNTQAGCKITWLLQHVRRVLIIKLRVTM